MMIEGLTGHGFPDPAEPQRENDSTLCKDRIKDRDRVRKDLQKLLADKL